MKIKPCWDILALIALVFCSNMVVSQTPYLHAPAINEYALHNPNGTTILPTGRLLRPAGRHFPVAQWPHGLVVSPDGRTAFVASDGVGQILSGWDGANLQTVILKPSAGAGRKGQANSGAAAFSADGQTLYWGSGDDGKTLVFDVKTAVQTGAISLNTTIGGRTFQDSFVIDMKLSADGKHLYCADVTNFRVAIIDTGAKRVISSVAVGRYPYALAVVGKRVYVTDIGMFEYRAIPAPANARFDKRGLTFPAFGFPSKAAKEGIQFEGRNVAGLGDPNVPESCSVWGSDV
jgi:YVTN family beta-propeller protein